MSRCPHCQYDAASDSIECFIHGKQLALPTMDDNADRSELLAFRATSLTPQEVAALRSEIDALRQDLLICEKQSVKRLTEADKLRKDIQFYREEYKKLEMSHTGACGELAALQAEIDEAREVAKTILLIMSSAAHPGEQPGYIRMHCGDRLRRIAADEPDAADRLMQVQCGDTLGKLQQAPEEPLPFTED